MLRPSQAQNIHCGRVYIRKWLTLDPCTIPYWNNFENSLFASLLSKKLGRKLLVCFVLKRSQRKLRAVGLCIFPWGLTHILRLLTGMPILYRNTVQVFTSGFGVVLASC